MKPRSASSGKRQQSGQGENKHRQRARARAPLRRTPSGRGARCGRRGCPAGMAKRRKGRVCAVCSRPVSPAPAPKAKTATMGAAASPICSADCASEIRPDEAIEARGSEIAEAEGETLASMKTTSRGSHLSVSAVRLADRPCDAYLWAWHAKPRSACCAAIRICGRFAQGCGGVLKPVGLPRKRRSAAVGRAALDQGRDSNALQGEPEAPMHALPIESPQPHASRRSARFSMTRRAGRRCAAATPHAEGEFVFAVSTTGVYCRSDLRGASGATRECELPRHAARRREAAGYPPLQALPARSSRRAPSAKRS